MNFNLSRVLINAELLKLKPDDLRCLIRSSWVSQALNFQANSAHWLLPSHSDRRLLLSWTEASSLLHHFIMLQLILLFLLLSVSLCSDQKFGRCRELSAPRICRPDRIGLTYNDGCNTITCLRGGRMITTSKFCRQASDRSSECQRLVLSLQETLERRKMRMICPSWQEVCERKPNTTFHLDCDSCTCESSTSAHCRTTDRCLPALRNMTDAEYNVECDRRLAEAIGERK